MLSKLHHHCFVFAFSVLLVTSVRGTLIRRPEDVTVDAGSNATFVCQADENTDLCWAYSSFVTPEVYVILSRANIPNPQNTDRKKFVYDNGTKTSYLLLTNVNRNDNGFYSCCNCIERQWFRGNLTVRECTEKCISVCVGHSKTLICYDPDTNGPTWSHRSSGQWEIIYSNRNIVKNKKHKFSVSADNGYYNLRILSALPDDAGSYRCAKNLGIGPSVYHELCVQVICENTCGSGSGTVSLHGSQPRSWSTLLFAAAVALWIFDIAHLR
jgi:hypothetical protein